ncbi:hypothetical protein EVAR_28534_1 [Eumeta japonica]|uniref:Uncharacterized protein n=1 Tax=Eumeta variegata TaxID=151549 RepID=A0A4C1UWS4_EUMVA|nr:hypothetical protein EVAR_28534_1 [Eumeta japonica]
MFVEWSTTMGFGASLRKIKGLSWSGITGRRRLKTLSVECSLEVGVVTEAPQARGDTYASSNNTVMELLKVAGAHQKFAGASGLDSDDERYLGCPRFLYDYGPNLSHALNNMNMLLKKRL